MIRYTTEHLLNVLKREYDSFQIAPMGATLYNIGGIVRPRTEIVPVMSWTFFPIKLQSQN